MGAMYAYIHNASADCGGEDDCALHTRSRHLVSHLRGILADYC